ncbi:MAG: beta-galactosidase, partial [Bacteroidales bacterium]|nr:beta-galactosidase [Bacteroidales bacterium]
QDVRQGDDSFLRWSYRTDGTSAFVFVNNYERFASLTAKRDVQFDVCGITFPQKPMTVPAGTSCIFPVNVCGIRYATAQLVACRDGNIYLEQLPGIPTEIALQEGRVLRNVKARGTAKPVYKNIYLVSHDEAGRLFLDESVISETYEYIDIPFKKVRPAGTPRTITIGARGAAEEPVDADFDEAAVYRIDLPAERSGLLLIGYRGDVARLYAVCGEGEKEVVRLVADNFYNGLSMRYGLWRLPADARYLELRILPLQEDMPVYFPREADTTPGEELREVNLRLTLIDN